MVKAGNLDRLRAALAEAATQGGLTLDAVCQRAGTSRATANRDATFMVEYRAVKARIACGAGEPCGAGTRPALRETGSKVVDLRASIDLMANVIQVLTLANDRLAADNEKLTRSRSPRK